MMREHLAIEAMTRFAMRRSRRARGVSFFSAARTTARQPS
jgi:hypothetical protein